MEDLSTKTACILDHGLFVSIAALIAPHFKRTFYAMGTAGSFPTTPEYSIGKGIPGVTRLKDFADAFARFKEIDLWIIPDLYLAGYAEHLRSLGARVWASGRAEKMELDRLAFKTWGAEAGLEVGTEGKDYHVLTGMDELEARMKRNPGWFVKMGDARSARGDFETLKSRSWEEVRFRLREIRARLGHRADTAKFILERPIEDAVELATDLYNVHGQFPETGLLGLEMKAECYVAKVVDYKDYPAGLVDVNEKMAPLFKASKYSNLSPVECRMTKDGTAHPIDPCMRFGRPPLSILYAITNWPEIFWEGGAGNLVQPEWRDVWAAESCVYCEVADHLPVPIEIPDDVKSQVFLSDYCISEGGPIVVPMHFGLTGIGSIVATGPTMEKAIANCRSAMAKVTGWKVEPADAFGRAEECLKTMKAYGIKSFD